MTNFERTREPMAVASRRLSRTAIAVLLALIAIHSVLSVSSLMRKSVTVDEFAHLPAGVYILESGDLGYAWLNPPLMNVLNALGASLFAEPGADAASEARIDGDLDGLWPGGYRYMAAHAGDYHARFVGARLITVVVVLLLGVLAFFWAHQLARARRDWAAVMAAALVLLSPNLLAHGRLVTTDAAMAAAMALALFVLGAFLRRPSVVRALTLGLALGLAQLVKFTAIYLYPVVVAAVLLWPRDAGKANWRPTIGLLAFALAISLFVIHLGYGFVRSAESMSSFKFVSDPLIALQRLVPDWLPSPVPGDYLEAFDRQARDAALGDSSYLLGESYHGGRWNYFLVILGAKLPLPVLAVLLLALAIGWRRRNFTQRERIALFALPILTILGVFSLLSEKQLGLRMVLPILPLMSIWAAVVIAESDMGKRGQSVALGLIVWLAFETVRIHPDYLSYFNSLVGGPSQGHRIALDSNLDWGQDLVALKETMDREGVDSIQLIYFGRVDPGIYGIDYTVPLNVGLRPGLLAVSSTFHGLDYVVFDHGRLRHGKRLGPVSSFGPPIARPGNSIRVYRIRDAD
ncbi:MAG: glycosyltransferase family 39 protein [Gammaproteobacteria bacterium]|nr:glycosyltransferase family 39 protein [Gammaproteobacteria bacterium]MDH3466131.1 glycosyltransferase family 39 protein [Gammaproteobacteria bacterium]